MGPAPVRFDAGSAVCLAVGSIGKTRAVQPLQIFRRFVFCGIEFSCIGSGGCAYGSVAQLAESFLLPQRSWRNVSEPGGTECHDQACAREVRGTRDGCLVSI